jgi:cytochrome P450
MRFMKLSHTHSSSMPGTPWPPGPKSSGPGWLNLPQMKRDPLGFARKQQSLYGDISYLRIWPEHIVQLSDPALVRELLVNNSDSLVRNKRMRDVFSQLHGQSIITAEGSKWKARRQAVQPLFLPRQLGRDMPGIVSTCRYLLDQWPKQETPAWPVQAHLSHLALAVILRTLFSVEPVEAGRSAEAAQIEKALRLISEYGNQAFYYPVDLPDWMPWKWPVARAKRFLDRFIRTHISLRVVMPQEHWPADILTQLMKLRDQQGKPLSAQELRDECMTLFLAGHDTTAASLTWWAWCMARHPEAQVRAAREAEEASIKNKAMSVDDLTRLPWLLQTVQESMRLYPVTPFLIMRCADVPVQLGSYRFPKGTNFQIPLFLMQTDPRWHPDPMAFQPDRFAASQSMTRGSHMPFGVGPRVCLGQHFAQAEILVAATLLLQRYRLELIPGHTEPVPEVNVTLRPKEALHLRLVPVCTS